MSAVFDKTLSGCQFIGIGHYARVGKDTLANAIIAECRRMDPHYTIRKLPWAAKLKDVCHQLYGWAGLRELEYYETEPGASQREVVLPALGKSPRQIWIDMGTHAVRDKVFHDTWRDYVLKTDHQADCIIVPDTRFFNEIDGLGMIRGHRVKVVRPGYGPGKNRPDRELVPYRGWNNVWLNSGSMDDVWAIAYEYANWLVGGGPEPTCTLEQMEERLSHEVVEPWEEQVTPWQVHVATPALKPLWLTEELAEVVLSNHAEVMYFDDNALPAESYVVVKSIFEAFPNLVEKYKDNSWYARTMAA